MQWLIDLIIETIGVPPCFVNKADPVVNAFTTPDFGVDGLWHELDFSPFVPEGTTAVLIELTGKHANIQQWIGFRLPGMTSQMGIRSMFTQVANEYMTVPNVIALDADRKCETRISNPPWTAITVKVRGWWL